jgi:hypothetical protein
LFLLIGKEIDRNSTKKKPYDCCISRMDLRYIMLDKFSTTTSSSSLPKHRGRNYPWDNQGSMSAHEDLVAKELVKEMQDEVPPFFLSCLRNVGCMPLFQSLLLQIRS